MLYVQDTQCPLQGWLILLAVFFSTEKARFVIALCNRQPNISIFFLTKTIFKQALQSLDKCIFENRMTGKGYTVFTSVRYNRSLAFNKGGNPRGADGRAKYSIRFLEYDL